MMQLSTKSYQVQDLHLAFHVAFPKEKMYKHDNGIMSAR